MSTYRVAIGEREYKVQIVDSHVLVNDEPVKADLIALNGNGLHIFRQGNSIREVYLSSQAQGVVEVLTGGRRLLARVGADGRRMRRKDTPQAGAVVAPMPGLVVNVLVKAGEWVEKDQVLMVLESMKMQMPLRAPFTGQVIRICVNVGAQVEKGTMLAEVGGRELPHVP
ncbi:MAG TPA: acetyl-CoA carboxylase biotin carboxyl carrier protein subunit [Anaerolineae bacterium]|nr:acetyl-CoA carboxylase biotin carboxyl carrier protein subunit [Anaerolineae bacterium]HQK14433.1 acetyl-CoA carboxylase biotin carboxyl carrier protein subunit [Anaerolineae bacterium]